MEFAVEIKILILAIFSKISVCLGSRCTYGYADGYACDDVDLEAHIRRNELNGSNKKLNDIWGWTDPNTRREYAIVGKEDGTAFVDITSSTNPKYLGYLPSHKDKVGKWRDMKTYKNHVFIVADIDDHGMQIFDLTQLRHVSGSPVEFQETYHYEIGTRADNIFGNRALEEIYNDDYDNGESPLLDSGSDRLFQKSRAYNIAINEDTGFAYLVGGDRCDGGLFILDILFPASPSRVGCLGGLGFIYDVQCINYNGPDYTYRYREICFAATEYSLAIIDVTDKTLPITISVLQDSRLNEIHQGWISENHRDFFIGDKFGGKTKTVTLDISNLDAPSVSNIYSASYGAQDSNVFVARNLVYQASFRAGLRILEEKPGGDLREIAYFDTYQSNNDAGREGALGVYPFFQSGTLIISSVEEGLFIVRHSINPSSRPSRQPSRKPSRYPSARPTNSHKPSNSPAPSHLPTHTHMPSKECNFGVITINIVIPTFFKRFLQLFE